MIGPMLPNSAERKLKAAPRIANPRSGTLSALVLPTWRWTTTAIRKIPSRRVRNESGAMAKSSPPMSAAGTPPSANQPTTGSSSSRRLNQLRHREDGNGVANPENQRQDRQQHCRSPKAGDRGQRGRRKRSAAQQEHLGDCAHWAIPVLGSMTLRSRISRM